MRPAPAIRATPSRGRLGLGCALALLAWDCRCGGTGAGRAYEVGAPLEDMPRAKPGPLAALVPAPAPVFVFSDRPGELLRQIRAAPRLRPLADPHVLQDLALSGAGATARALRQRLSELSRLPTAVDAAALLDGPLALAARAGPGDPDLLFLKRLGPGAAASWRAAQMLQAVRPSHTEVRVERYRGLPLRKVLVDEGRRLTYAVLKDLLVAGTSDAWVKQSLDLALSEAGPGALTAQQQPAIAAGLSSGAQAALTAIVDADAVRAEPGKPGLAALALAQVAWLRLTVERSGALRVLASRSRALPSPASRSPSALERFAPRRVSAALSRRVDLPRALADLLGPAEPQGVHAEKAAALRAAILANLAPRLGDEVFWFCEGVDAQDGKSVARHVLGLRLKDPAGFATAFAALEPTLLAPPLVVEREAGRAVTCAGEGESLCFAQADDVLLVSNGADGLRAALAAGRARPSEALKVPPGGDLLLLDGPGLAAALEGMVAGPSGPAGAEPPEARRRPEPLLAALQSLGSLSAALRPKPPALLEGEVVAR
jgi:hypothetical protein